MTEKSKNVEKHEEVPKIELKEVKLPKYQIVEHMKDMQDVTVNLFKLNLEELVFEKMYILFEKLNVANNNLESAKVERQQLKDKLLVETDFKAELGISTKPTIADKEAVMQPQLAPFDDKIDKCTEEVEFYKNKLTIINDLINTRRLELKIETALHGED